MGKKVERLKLKPEIKEKWLKALRSGEYAQTNGALSNEEGFCCLGVLCDIKNKEDMMNGASNQWFEADMHKDDDSYGFTNIHDNAIPPEVVVRWATSNYDEVSSDDKDEKHLFKFRQPHKKISNLAIHNDAGVLFTKIADIIEKEF